MGSSFSDLDDASVTQSALEEALMSNMGNTTTTNTMASRVSGIGQALRSRYFEAGGGGGGRGGTMQEHGDGRGSGNERGEQGYR